MKIRHRDSKIVLPGPSDLVAAHLRDHCSQNLNTSTELRQLLSFELAYGGREFFNAAGASGGENLTTFWRRFDVRQSFVARIILSFYQPILLQSGDYPSHRGWLYLFRARELPQR